MALEFKQERFLVESEFHPENARKYESIFSQGNGYMGIRASTEEHYEKTVPYALVAGTFDMAEEKNCNELPCFGDLVSLVLSMDGQPLQLTQDNHAYYQRSLDLQNGLLCRSFLWTPAPGVKLSFCSERFVSLAQRHCLAQRIVLEAVEGGGAVSLETGIFAGVRYGAHHFENGQGRTVRGLMQHREITHESGVDFVTTAAVQVWHLRGDGSRTQVEMTPCAHGERVTGTYRVKLLQDEALVVEKLCRVATSRDRDLSQKNLPEDELTRTEALSQKGYGALWEESRAAWEALWEERDVHITQTAQTPIPDQLAVRFAIYHLTCMAPLHDNRMNIGAKGLSGKGYFGHTFWDTEIYMLPYFIWEDPKGARSLLEYRFNCLPAARENAIHYGQKGARFPWEGAWITDRESCPEDRFSKHEVHVTADVAYGVYAYHAITGDLDFMLRCGCQLLFETAQFWVSRLDYNEKQDRYEILDVIGPDEFTHQANNNAYTNYLAHTNLELAAQWYDTLQAEHPADFARLEQELHISTQVEAWRTCAGKLKLPRAGEDNILPQDDDYMTLPEIDLSIYRAGLKKLRKDYPYPTYTRLKVSKQADVMNLFLLREDRFTQQVKQASLAYYEPYCVHESSLSLCAYSMLAADCGEQEKAAQLFEKAKAIDIGPNMKSSDEGIHAASLGGIWQCCVLGFGGVRLCGKHLRIEPNLPAGWESISFRIWWQGSCLQLNVDKKQVCVQVLEGPETVTVLTGKGLLTGEKSLSWEY